MLYYNRNDVPEGFMLKKQVHQKSVMSVTIGIS